MALIGSERDAPRPPVSRHPAFPAIVALWFAALLGFGSMVLPAALLERGVAMTGIAAYVPAANPPLGLTARALIALAMALVGALAGIAIARRVARAHDDDSPSRNNTFANGARRPIDATTELGGEGLASEFGQPVTRRRRALTIAEDDRPGDALDADPFAEPGASDPVPAYDERSYTREAIDTPFEPYPPFEDSSEAWDDAEATGPEDGTPMSVPQDFAPLPPEPQGEPRQEFRPAPPMQDAEPLPFAAPSLARRAIEPDAFASEPETDEPELVQLVQRLKTSLERRREGLATAPAAEPAPPPSPPADFEPVLSDDATRATAAYFGKLAGAIPSAEDLPDEDEDDEADGGYSSLLAMRGPYTPGGSSRAYADEPEAGDHEAEPAEPVDTDAALRAALAKLQRMGGSA